MQSLALLVGLSGRGLESDDVALHDVPAHRDSAPPSVSTSKYLCK